MNAKTSVLVICIEAIIYLSLYNLHDCTFNKKSFIKKTYILKLKLLCLFVNAKTTVLRKPIFLDMIRP